MGVDRAVLTKHQVDLANDFFFSQRGVLGVDRVVWNEHQVC